MKMTKQIKEEIMEVFDTEDVKDDGTGNLEIDGGEYSLMTDDEAFDSAKEYMKESIWAFNPSFLSKVTGIDFEIFSELRKLEYGANEAILAIVNDKSDIDRFVELAIEEDGRGHFNSPYDGEEIEIYVGDETYYLYRMN